MMRQTTIVLGVLLALAVATLATPPGQALLGLRSTERAQPLTVIKDPPPTHVAPPRPHVPQPAVRPAAAPSRTATSPAPQAQGVPSLGQVFTKLLSLPQIIAERIRHPGDDH